MGHKPSFATASTAYQRWLQSHYHHHQYAPNRRVLLMFFSLLLISIALLFLIPLSNTSPSTEPRGFKSHNINPNRLMIIPKTTTSQSLMAQQTSPTTQIWKRPRWYNVIMKHSSTLYNKDKIRVGLVNSNDAAVAAAMEDAQAQMMDIVNVQFDKASPDDLEWTQLFPEWIDEENPKCPEMPMPAFERYHDLDVVVAMPCCTNNNKVNVNDSRKGVRDVLRLQMNLVVANLVVESAIGRNGSEVYVVFVGGCEPMWEIFRCDDVIWEDAEYMVYKPNVQKLQHIVSLPIGTCELASPWTQSERDANTIGHKREAYVTVLHSSEDYVCGAIVLAQSILQTNTTKDLVLLADSKISPLSVQGLQSAGWKVKQIKRIRSPGARPDAYNEWNYSKLRVWQLTEYDKIMFIDADFIVLNNIDHFFAYPQLSAAPNNRWLFNSGIMIVEPSTCTFDKLMARRYDIDSYNGGDQGYLNEVFTWWHRLTLKLNYLKFYSRYDSARDVKEGKLTIHYLGLKPWICYRDYDCNWDRNSTQIFASDEAHERWWRVYDRMPTSLQPYCSLTKKMDERIQKWRGTAMKAKLPNKHWTIEVKDARHLRLINSS